MHRKKPKMLQPVKTREELEAEFGQVWSVQELARDFTIQAICSPDVVVVRRRTPDDEAVGTLHYQAGPPCLYYNFTPQPRE